MDPTRAFGTTYWFLRYKSRHASAPSWCAQDCSHQIDVNKELGLTLLTQLPFGPSNTYLSGASWPLFSLPRLQPFHHLLQKPRTFVAAHTTLDTGASSAVDLPRSIQEKLQATA